MRGRRALGTAIAVLVLSQALPAAAQSGPSAQTCRTVRGRMVCSYAARPGGVAGTHAYDRWSDGSPAIGGTTSLDTYQFPQYLGGHNAWYGLGR